MRYLKLLFKILIGLVGLFVILLIVLLNAESYKTITKRTGTGTEIVKIEIKKVFGKKISESTINADGFYHGPSKSWYFFKGKLHSEGNYKNGYWNGLWKSYDRNGQLMMHREFSMGVPTKVFMPAGNSFKELSKNEWPEYLNFNQSEPQRAHEK